MYMRSMSRLKDKNQLNEVFARVGKGLAHANRLELLELLAQGERDVESLSICSGMSFANTSHHLRLLRQCGLIKSRQSGQRVIYRLADDSVVSMISILHSVAVNNLPELDRLLAERFPSGNNVHLLGPEAMADVLREESPQVFDLRPKLEFNSGHIPGAVLADLDSLQKLPDAAPEKRCIVYCRSRYCLLPLKAADVLAPKGYVVNLLEGGFPAWRIGGFPVESC